MTRFVATWILEKGALLGTIEQLFWSSTVFSTISTHLALRSFNWLGLGLFILWVLSPLGGQSSLHIITIERHTTVSSVDATYLGPGMMSTLASGGDYSDAVPTLNTLYSASIMSPDSAQESSMDLWGNLKIPQASRLPANLSADSNGWINVSSLSKVPYASLLGIPINVPSQRNMSFTLESTYFDLDCFNITSSPAGIPYLPYVNIPGEGRSKPTDTARIEKNEFVGGNGSTICSDQSDCPLSFGLGFNRVSVYSPYPPVSFPNVTGNNKTFLPEKPVLLYQSWAFSAPNYTLAYCHIDQVYMESAVRCTENSAGTTSGRPECYVTAIRDSRLPHPAKDVVPFIFNGFMSNFANNLGVSGGYGKPVTATQTDRFMANVQTKAEYSSGNKPLYTIPKDEFTARLNQVINTYYQGSLLPYYMFGNLPKKLPTDIAPTGVTNQTATQRTWDPYIYKVHWGWAIVFFLSSLAMFASAVFTTFVAHRTRVPDILGYVSSNLRNSTDNPYFPQGGSYMNGLERSRLMKDLPVKLGDIRPGDDGPGCVAFAGLDTAKPVVKGRLYL